MYKVLIVDNYITRKGLKEVVGLAFQDVESIEAASMPDAILALKGNPDLALVLIDLMNAENEGLGIIDSALQYAPSAKIIVISGKDDRETKDRVIAAGADGFISKSYEVDRIIDDMKRCFNGSLNYDASDQEPALPTEDNLSISLKCGPLRRYNLSDKEIKISQRVVNGLSTKEISESTYLSVGTIKKHLDSIFEKLDVSNREELIRKLNNF